MENSVRAITRLWRNFSRKDARRKKRFGFLGEFFASLREKFLSLLRSLQCLGRMDPRHLAVLHGR